MDMFSRRFVSVPTTESNPIWPRSITFIKYTSKDGAKSNYGNGLEKTGCCYTLFLEDSLMPLAPSLLWHVRIFSYL